MKQTKKHLTLTCAAVLLAGLTALTSCAASKGSEMDMDRLPNSSQYDYAEEKVEAEAGGILQGIGGTADIGAAAELAGTALPFPIQGGFQIEETAVAPGDEGCQFRKAFVVFGNASLDDHITCSSKFHTYTSVSAS